MSSFSLVSSLKEFDRSTSQVRARVKFEWSQFFLFDVFNCCVKIMHQRHKNSKIWLGFFSLPITTVQLLHKFDSQLLFKEANIPRHALIFHTDSYLHKLHTTETEVPFQQQNVKVYVKYKNFSIFRARGLRDSCSRKKRSTSGGSPQFPNGFSGKLLFHLTFNRNFRIFWLNGKHP